MVDLLPQMKSISEFRKEGLGVQFRKNLSLAWYFETWLDKSILILIGVLGLWKAFEIGWGLL